ncbi:MAG: TIGR04222 domain-containing membrane protein [Planctomycetota bacterium]
MDGRIGPMSAVTDVASGPAPPIRQKSALDEEIGPGDSFRSNALQPRVTLMVDSPCKTDQLAQLIHKVESFQIDPGEKTLSFAARLARENAWSHQYADRVTHEYKRFCVLAMISGHPVTPSEHVDQVWHLHMTYTRSYWERFCDATLGGPLHHDPTAGGQKEGEKFRDWYSETLASYQRVFGKEPPQDIWPTPRERFRHAGDQRWINSARYWVIPKRSLVTAIMLSMLIVSLFVFPGCNAELNSVLHPSQLTQRIGGNLNPFNWGGMAFLQCYLAGCLVLLAAIVWLRLRSSEPQRRTIASDHDLSRDDIAVLSGGGGRLAHVVLTRLYIAGCIELKKGWLSQKLVAKGSAPKSSTIDQDVYAMIQANRSTTEIMSIVQPHFERIDRQLQAAGLRHPSGVYSVTSIWITIGMFLLGACRCVQGTLTDQATGYLVLSVFAFTVVAIATNYRSGGATMAGKTLIHQMKRTSTMTSYKDGHQRKSASGLQPAEADAAIAAVALTGVSALESFSDVEPLNSALLHFGRHTSAGGGCGSGCSGCGGGGCGVGCGGCGG